MSSVFKRFCFVSLMGAMSPLLSSAETLPNLPVEIHLEVISKMNPLFGSKLQRVSKSWKSKVNITRYKEDWKKLTGFEEYSLLPKSNKVIQALDRHLDIVDVSAKTRTEGYISSRPSKIVISPMEDKVALIGVTRGLVVMFDAQSGQEIEPFGFVINDTEDYPYLNSAAFSLDGKQIWMGGDDGQITVRDTDTAKLLFETKATQGKLIENIVFSPNGEHVLTVTGSLALIWSPEGKHLYSFNAGKGVLLYAAFSPSGDRLVTTSSDHHVAVWDLATGKLSYTINEFWLRKVTFSPDGENIAFGTESGYVFLYEAKSGKLIHKLSGNKGFVGEIKFSIDGQILLTAGGNELIAWDVYSGNEVMKLPVEDIGRFDLFPDGKRIATYSSNGKMTLWTVDMKIAP